MIAITTNNSMSVKPLFRRFMVGLWKREMTDVRIKTSAEPLNVPADCSVFNSNATEKAIGAARDSMAPDFTHDANSDVCRRLKLALRHRMLGKPVNCQVITHNNAVQNRGDYCTFFH